MINKKRKLIFEFENKENGIMVHTKTKGHIKLQDIVLARKIIDDKVKDNVKDKRK